MAAKREKITGGWEVYIVETESGKLYTGISTDVERRFGEHADGKRGARFFRMSRPGRIVFREKRDDRSGASVREAEIKRMPRAEKLRMIERSGKEKRG